MICHCLDFLNQAFAFSKTQYLINFALLSVTSKHKLTACLYTLKETYFKICIKCPYWKENLSQLKITQFYHTRLCISPSERASSHLIQIESGMYLRCIKLWWKKGKWFFLHFFLKTTGFHVLLVHSLQIQNTVVGSFWTSFLMYITISWSMDYIEVVIGKATPLFFFC